MTSDEKKLLAIYNKISKITDKGDCLWNNCTNKGISSHSHTESILRNIAISNKLYGVNKNFISFHKGEFFKSYGVNEASTFCGFCSEHDQQLFKPIESGELRDINPKSAFLFFARNIFFEISQKNTAIFRFLKFLQLAKENKLTLHDDMVINQINGYEYFLKHKANFYRDKIYMIYAKQSYDDICYLYKIIEKPLQISLSTMIDMDITRQIFDDLPSFCLNIIPYQHFGIVVLTWLKQHDEHMGWICDQFEKNFNKLVNYLCFIESEDFLFSTKLYNETIRHNCDFFKKAFFNRISFPDFGYGETEIFFNFGQ